MCPEAWNDLTSRVVPPEAPLIDEPLDLANAPRIRAQSTQDASAPRYHPRYWISTSTDQPKSIRRRGRPLCCRSRAEWSSERARTHARCFPRATPASHPESDAVDHTARRDQHGRAHQHPHMLARRRDQHDAFDEVGVGAQLADRNVADRAERGLEARPLLLGRRQARSQERERAGTARGIEDHGGTWLRRDILVLDFSLRHPTTSLRCHDVESYRQSLSS